jgi:NAD(P)H dehydrogenase (quinone)
MHTLVVHAHPEPTSFSAALMHAAVQTLRARGHEVEVSDLHAMRFDPISDRRNFTTCADAARLRLQSEEAHASRHGGFVPELAAEMAKLARCDALLLVFPLWWLGMPAILKGWVDRVFAAGVAYGGDRSFAHGVMRGKRAMCVVTTGGHAQAYADGGAYAPLGTVLYPIRRGILEFTGFDVRLPFAAHAPHRADPAEREAVLESLRHHLVRFLLPAHPPPDADEPTS